METERQAPSKGAVSSGPPPQLLTGQTADAAPADLYGLELPRHERSNETKAPASTIRPGTDLRATPTQATIAYVRSDALPKLGWVATLDCRTGRLSVLHGNAVECRPTWLVEGVWNGRFEDGEFHRGAHLFGSGVRLEGDSVYFMPSSALVDRLFYCRDGDELLVSNSLLALLAVTGAELDADHDYVVEAKAISDGVDCETSFHVLHPSIDRFHQVFHKAIIARNAELTLERTIGVRSFESFAEYFGMLDASLKAICDNAADPGRRTPLELYGTLSSGYDSTAVSSIVRNHGVDEFFTYVGAWSPKSRGQADFETAPIAKGLGVKTVQLHAPREPAVEDDLLLRAASPLGSQLPLLSMSKYIERNAQSAVLFTGFHGDIIWDMNVPEKFVSEAIIRHDISGLDLSELRLKSGFYNVAAPFLYAASIASVVAISRADEMKPWRVNTGYDRPISRRIVETAGVPRSAFGFLKGGIFGGATRPTNPALRARYSDYVRERLLPLPLFYLRAGFDRYALRIIGKAMNFSKHRLGSLELEAYLAEYHRRICEGYSWVGRLNVRSALYTFAVNELVRELRSRGLGAPSSAAAASASPPTPPAEPLAVS